MSGTDSCIFCQIVAREIPATVIAESEGAIAFSDVRPVTPTHVLVVPKTHVTSAAEIGPEHGEILAEVFTLAHVAAERSGVAERGYRLVFNVGEDAGNTVPHLHLHLLGGRPLGWPPG